MIASLRKLRSDLSETFWLVPGLMVLAGVLAAIGFLRLDRSGNFPLWLLQSSWLYNGGATGARTLLGAVASSTIGVAGTVFSITIAARFRWRPVRWDRGCSATSPGTAATRSRSVPCSAPSHTP